MNSILKKIVFTVAFVLIVLVLPMLLLLLFVDTTTSLSAYLIVFGVILFAIFGYIIASVNSMEKKLDSALEDIKMQNAAIAYKISSADAEPTIKAVEPKVAENNTLNVPLNPAEPLVVTEHKVATEPKKVVDDNFDDFK